MIRVLPEGNYIPEEETGFGTQRNKWYDSLTLMEQGEVVK